MTATAQPAHRIPALDGYRGFAVLWVFLYHYGGGTTSPNPGLHAFGAFCRAGWAGVTLFFVLSGFLITSILRQNQNSLSLRNFYTRRALRILPLYYGVLLLCFLSAFFIPDGIGWRMRFYAAPLLFLLDLPRLSLHWISELPARFSMFHLWSLSVEEQFYLLWPLLFLFVRSRFRQISICMLMIALSVAFRCWAAGAGVFPPWTQTLPSRAGELALGALLALWIRDSSATRLRIWKWSALVLSAMGFALASRLAGSDWPNNAELTTASVFAAALLLTSLLSGPVAAFFNARWLRALGRWSFGIYIFHVLFLPQFHAIAAAITGTNTGSKFLVTRFIVAAACSIAAAAASFRFYESRFLRFRSRFPMQLPDAPVASAPSGARY